MKKSATLLILTTLVFSQTIFASDITFIANVTTTGNIPIPKVYIKFYEPGVVAPVDSMFTDSLGNITRTIKIASSLSELENENSIIKNIYPSIISKETQDYILEYNYESTPRLFFVNIEGKEFQNNSELAEGIYFCYLKFADGIISEYKRIVVSEKCIVKFQLIDRKNMSDFVKLKSVSGDTIIAVIIKDGYVYCFDTIPLTNTTINRSYILSLAAKPTAIFSYSGVLQVGQPVLFNAGSSYSANGEELVFQWDFGNSKKGQSMVVPHVFNDAGTYNVILTVTGKYGAKHSVGQSVTVTDGTSAISENGKVRAIVTGNTSYGLAGVKVQLVESDISSTTDIEGSCTLTNLPVAIPLHFKVSKSGYVSQVAEVFIPHDTIEGIFYASLKVRETAKILPNVEFGGSVNGTDGSYLFLPHEALIDNKGDIVQGNINVNVTPVNVVDDIANFPGDFSGYSNEGVESILLSYGVSEFHFEQDGNELQLADGKTAEVLIPIYTSGAVLGDEIPLWSVNEDNGTWVQEGIGIVVQSEESPTGLALQAQVGHFSWWNCDDFGSSRRKRGKCYKWLCNDLGTYCTHAEVLCWVNGRRNEGAEQRNMGKVNYSTMEEEAEEPVFEVRAFLPGDGEGLLFPTTRDVYIQARGIDNLGNIYFGEDTVLASDDADTFAIMVEFVEETDKIKLKTDTLVEYYIESGEFIVFKVNIPEDNKYHLYFKKQTFPYLNNAFVLSDTSGKVLEGGYSSLPYILNLHKGDYILLINGIRDYDKGNVCFGLFGQDSTTINAGDTVIGDFEYRFDTNLFTFTGQKGEIVAIDGDHSYNRLGLALVDSLGNVIISRPYETQQNNNIVCELPYDGYYTIYVWHSYNTYPGTYELRFIEPEVKGLPLNSFATDTVKIHSDYFYKFTLPGDKKVHFSIVSNTGSGGFNIWKKSGERVSLPINTTANYTAYGTTYGGVFSGNLSAGEYFIKVENYNATQLYMNLWEATPFSFDSKGKAEYTDSITEQYQVNVYDIGSDVETGIHTQLRKVDGFDYPQNVTIDFYSVTTLKKAENTTLLSNISSNKDTFMLVEASVEAKLQDTSLVIVVRANSAGIFNLKMYVVPTLPDIVVDDDFSQYPGANTSSVVAAALAVQDGGSITIADGEYDYCIPVKVNIDNVTFSGQSREGVRINSIYNDYSVSALLFNSPGGKVTNLTVGACQKNAPAIHMYDDATLENVTLSPLGGVDSISNGIYVYKNSIVRNVLIEKSSYGFLAGANLIIENCTINTSDYALYSENSPDLIFRNNIINSTSNGNVISLTGGRNLCIDSNIITVNSKEYDPWSGGDIIRFSEYGGAYDSNTTYVRNNIILHNTDRYAFSASIYRPPSKIIIENNITKCADTKGGKALMVYNTYSGTSSIIVRNNIFEGLRTGDVIHINNAENTADGHQIAIYNNSFRFASSALTDANDYFMYFFNSQAGNDTVNTYLVNNIFQGSTDVNFVESNDSVSLWCDYNIIYNYKNIEGVNTQIIGGTNNIASNPLFIDDNLHVDATSPAINNGADRATYPLLPDLDLEGVVRPQGSGYDIGSYEHVE